jgi:hypothetical protein
VVVVAPPANETESATTILEQLNRALKVESFRDAVRSVAEVLRVKRARVYELGLSLDRKRD